MPDTLSRTFQPTRRVLGDVDPAQPLDPISSLTDGLQGFWLPLPKLTGGSRLYDLSGYGRHGSFIDMGDEAWAVDSKVSHPVLDIADKADVVDTKFDEAPPDTFTAWMYVRGDLIDGGYSFARDNASFGGNSWRFFKGNWEVSNNAKLSAGSFDSSKFNLFVGTFNRNGEQRIYTNGDLINSAAASGDVATPSANVYIGGRADGGIKNHTFAAVGYHYREFSQSDVDLLFNEARRGFPDLLNRRSDVGLLGGGGGGTADTVSPSTATALAEAFDPALTATPNTISAGTAQAAAQGFSATVTATQNTVSAGTAQATAQGFAPTISADPNTIGATTGQAGAQGFDPTISEGAAGDTITADLGTAQAQAFDPTITTNAATVTLGLGQATANGFDPDVVADPSEINTGQGQAAATGFDPTITTNARTVAPQLGTAQAQGFEPAVVDGTVGVATTMEIEARPLYEIDVEAKPLYRIRLFVKEQLP
jgi:hypothetical protein